MHRSNCFILGDFNAQYTNWSSRNGSCGNQISDSALKYYFMSPDTDRHIRIKLVNYLQCTSPDIADALVDIAINYDKNTINENLGSDHIFIKIRNNYYESIDTTKKQNMKEANWEINIPTVI